jgi:hypothetical protein
MRKLLKNSYMVSNTHNMDTMIQPNGTIDGAVKITIPSYIYTYIV